jgi:hypothetical protein
MDHSLGQLQTKLETYLRGLNKSRGVHVLAHRQSNISSVLCSASDSALGVVMIILPPHPVSIVPNAPSSKTKTVCKSRTVEDFVTSETGRSAIFAAEEVILHFWRPQVVASGLGN